MKLFLNHKDAANQLLSLMPVFEMKKENWIVLSISKSGVFLASEIAKATNSEFDHLFTEPIFAPANSECAVAVVSETDEIVINYQLISSFGISTDYIYGEAMRKHDEKIISTLYKHRKGEHLADLRSRRILLVDEGADTGLTLMVALKTVLAFAPTKVAVAIPVLPESLSFELYKIVDDAYIVHNIANYVESKHYYKYSELITDQLCDLEQKERDELPQD